MHAGNVTCLLAAILASIPFPAMADWQYTKWGMTADQVVAASSGAATLYNGPKANKADDDGYITLAVGSYKTGDMTFETAFLFSPNKKSLQCVKLTLKSKDVHPYALRQSMASKYGKPAETKNMGYLAYDRWRPGDEITLILSQYIPPQISYCNMKRLKGAGGL